VPEHDAFGRPIGEDPLAALRGAAEPDLAERRQPAPPEEPQPIVAAAPEPAAAEPAAAAPPRPVFVRRRKRGRGVVLLLVFAIVIAGAVPAVVGVVAEDVRRQVEGVLPGPVEAAAPPVGLESESMIRRANFADAMERLQELDLGRPANLRVAPERIDATLVTEGGRASQVQVRFDGDVQQFSTSDTGVSPQTVPFDRIDAGAPERLVRRGARRTGTPVRRIDYLVFGTGAGLPWGAYFKGGTIVQGDARGRPRRVI
jgi:hypothetical protein